MSATCSINESYQRVVSLSRNGERISHVFCDHRLSLHDLEENGRGPLYYLIAHDYATGEETFVWLKDKEEFISLQRDLDKEAKKKTVGQQFVAAVKALHVQRFCDKWLAEEEAAMDLKKAAELVRNPSDDELFELCSEPLWATTDPLKLKELEERFPGATMVLSLEPRQRVVKYVYEDLYEDSSINHMISCEGQPYAVQSFASIGCKGRPNLMAEWRGMYVDLTHLF